MYEHKGLEDIFFLMLYGGAAMLAVAACCYLLLSRGNLFAPNNKSPKELRRWAAAFLASVAASHVWWVLLGLFFLTDDRLVRNIVAITLDRLTFVPLMICVLMRMLQDRRRPLWPLVVVFAPIAIVAVVCIVTHNDGFEWMIEIYSLLISAAFVIYYVFTLRQYGRWLRENFADLERKEYWQSLLLLAFILFMYVGYSSNNGDILPEYLAQINTILIILFIVWRVDTLQQLDESVEENEATTPENEENVAIEPEPVVVASESGKESNTKQMYIPENIGTKLMKYCEEGQLYLAHDLSLQQLAATIGTNRTYLSAYFAQQDTTYNAYINRLRIEHFMRLYLENSDSSRAVTAMALAQQSGFHSYSTFSSAFKKHTGNTVTEWMKGE